MIEIDIQKPLYGINGHMNLEFKTSIKRGDFISLTGKSGSGKTILLRILCGLENASGTIKLDNKIWLDKNTCISPQKRKIGFIFQDYALFDNMSVEENLLYINKDKTLANKLLEITELSTLKKRPVYNLSGGQKQRVSICRALMNKPQLLLMDEPLSALDSSLRLKLQKEIKYLHEEFNLSTIMVSHDPSEIYKLSKKVLLLDNGKIIREGSPKEVLVKTNGSSKLSFEGEILEITKIDVIYLAIVSIDQQIVEIMISKEEAKNLKIGQIVNISTKSFSTYIYYLPNF